MAEGKPHILETRELSVGYAGRQGFVYRKDLNLSVKQGELVALVGKNGVGKSTLLRTIAGLQRPLKGEIRIGRRPVAEYSPKEFASLVGFVSTEPVLVNNMKVFDLVALGRYPYTNWFGTNRPDDLEKIETSMQMVGISGLKNKNIHHISDGERQRAMIARTLAQDTRLIIMDEPTAFLDLPNKYEIVSLLKKLTRNQGKAVVFSTHELGIAIEEADKIWLQTEEGIQQGAPEDLILQRQFSKMFGKKASSYISDKGELKIRKEYSGKIDLEGSGREFLMTKKALERIGYEVDPKSSNEKKILLVQSESFCRWMMISEGREKEFSNIYDLLGFLQNMENE